MQEKLFLLRRRKGYSQKDMAEYLGINETTYNRKERGRAEFTSDEMFAIKHLFGCNLEDIFMPRGNQIGDKSKVI